MSRYKSGVGIRAILADRRDDQPLRKIRARRTMVKFWQRRALSYKNRAKYLEVLLKSAQVVTRPPHTFTDIKALLPAGIDIRESSPGVITLHSHSNELLAALQMYEVVFEDLFSHCLNNGIFNAWGKSFNCAKLNEAHSIAGTIINKLTNKANS